MIRTILMAVLFSIIGTTLDINGIGIKKASYWIIMTCVAGSVFVGIYLN